MKLKLFKIISPWRKKLKLISGAINQASLMKRDRYMTTGRYYNSMPKSDSDTDTDTDTTESHRFSRAEKGKSLEYEEPEVLEQPDYLQVRIYRTINIDKDFRRLTSNRFYSVKAWIHPDEVYSTRFYRPNLFRDEMDPVWEEEVKIPIGELTRVEDLNLHLEIVRAMRGSDFEGIDQPGPSSLRWVVGGVRMSLDGLEMNTWEKKVLMLMQKDGMSKFLCEWKPEGAICVAVKLVLESDADDCSFKSPSLSENGCRTSSCKQKSS